MPNLTGSEKHPPKWKLEYLTFALPALHPPPPTAVASNDSDADAQKKKDGFMYPIPLKHLPRKLRDANVTKSKFAPYAMEDLTIPSWMRLARKLSDRGHRKLRKRFRRYMFLGAA